MTIEVAEQDDVPLGVSGGGGGGVGEDLLDHPFRPAVRVCCGLLRRALVEGERVGVAVDGSRRGEYDRLAAVVAHGVDESERRPQVVGVVLDGLLDGLPDSLVAGEVDYRVDLPLFPENLVERICVADVGLVERHVRGCLVAYDCGDSVEDDFR